MSILQKLEAEHAAKKMAAAGAIELVPYQELIDPDLESNELVAGLINAGTLAVIYGEPGCGKTFITLDLALHVAIGAKWFDHEIDRPYNVIYVAAEAGKGIKNRIAAWHHEFGGDLIQPQLDAVVCPVDLSSFDAVDVARLRNAIGDRPVDLIVIDTLARVTPGCDENNAAGMGGFIEMCDRVRDELGCAIIVIHHCGKDQSRGMRGWSGLLGAVDTEIFVQKNEDRLASTVCNTKQRDLPLAGDIAFSLKQVGLGVNNRGREVTSCVVERSERVQAKLTKKAKADQTTQEIYEILLDLAMERNTDRVPQADWTTAMLATGKWTVDNVRMAKSRAQSKLIDASYIRFDPDDVKKLILLKVQAALAEEAVTFSNDEAPL